MASVRALKNNTNMHKDRKHIRFNLPERHSCSGGEIYAMGKHCCVTSLSLFCSRHRWKNSRGIQTMSAVGRTTTARDTRHKYFQLMRTEQRDVRRLSTSHRLLWSHDTESSTCCAFWNPVRGKSKAPAWSEPFPWCCSESECSSTRWTMSTADRRTKRQQGGLIKASLIIYGRIKKHAVCQWIWSISYQLSICLICDIKQAQADGGFARVHRHHLTVHLATSGVSHCRTRRYSFRSAYAHSSAWKTRGTNTCAGIHTGKLTSPCSFFIVNDVDSNEVCLYD